MLPFGHGVVRVDAECAGVDGWVETSAEGTDVVEGLHGVPGMGDGVEFTIGPDGWLGFGGSGGLMRDCFGEGLLELVEIVDLDRCSGGGLMASVGEEQAGVGVGYVLQGALHVDGGDRAERAAGEAFDDRGCS